MPYIKYIYAREVLDSRGIPTVEAQVYTHCGVCGSAIAPSGDGVGIYEAMEQRDDSSRRYMGKGVLHAVENVNKTIAKMLIGMCVLDQVGIDRMLIRRDGTANKGNLGSNAILAVSMACARAAALCQGQPLYRIMGGFYAHTLPVPMLNILSSVHRGCTGMSFQEFMIMPSNAENYKAALQTGAEVIDHMEQLLLREGCDTAIGRGGGFAPDFSSNEKALRWIVKAIEAAGYCPGKDVQIGLDVAADKLWINGKYQLNPRTAMEMTGDELIEYYEYLCDKFPVCLIRDGLDEDDWEGWVKMTRRLGQKISVTGDRFFSASPDRLKMGIRSLAGNSVIIKPGQIGTLTEIFQTIEIAKRAGYDTIISYSPGESEDSFIADLAVAVNCGKICAGSIKRSEHTAKYNRLLRICDELGTMGTYGCF